MQEQTRTAEPNIDSDRESNKSDSESDPVPTKEQDMFIWNPEFKKWHECAVMFYPPSLHIVEYEDQKLEVNENQLKHLTQRWYHHTLSRREAGIILQDFGGGTGSFLVRTSQSHHGKFAVSFVHESRVKHLIIESRKDPVTGILYSVTSNGLVFSSLCELIKEAQRRPIIQNQMFDIRLTSSPPKPDMSWLHEGVKSLSQAEQILKNEHRDGAFFVYRTQSQYAPYIVIYRRSLSNSSCSQKCIVVGWDGGLTMWQVMVRPSLADLIWTVKMRENELTDNGATLSDSTYHMSNGSILHNLLHSQKPNSGYTLNHVTSQVLYKVVHYFMENPINGKTVLRYPVVDRISKLTNTGIAIKDWLGDGDMNELSFMYGSLITNIQKKSKDWLVGDHRGDKQMNFKRSHIRFLTKNELEFVKELKNIRYRRIQSSVDTGCIGNTVELCLQNNYTFDLAHDEDQLGDMNLVLQSTNLSVDQCRRTYRLSCPSLEDCESWYQSLRQENCLQSRRKQLMTKSKLNQCKIC